MKRQQAHAAISGDTKTFEQVGAQYAEEFPEFSQIAPLSPTLMDMKRYNQERYITTTQRMLNGLVKEIGSEWESSIVEFEPDLIGGY
jgi:hypothetical protein